VSKSRQTVFYIGGLRGGHRRNTTYYPGARPGDSVVQKQRQALVRRFGRESAAVLMSSGGGGHTANSGDTGIIPTVLGQWSVVHVVIADNSSETIDFGTASGIAAVFGFMEIKRNRATAVRELRTIRIAQIGAAVFMGEEIDRNSSGADPSVTITPSIAAGKLILTLTTSNDTPDATADVQLLYTKVSET
jgi:hypothetical protein